MAKPWIYADTSAFLKLFIKEAGTERMRRLAREHRLLSSTVIRVESRSALARRQRDGELDEREFERVLLHLADGLLAIELVRITDDILNLSSVIVLRLPVRTMDALHIASAIVFQERVDIALTFVTADKKQHEAAQREGLATVLLS